MFNQKHSKNDTNSVNEKGKTVKSKADVMEKSVQTDEVCLHPCEMCPLKFISEDSLKVSLSTIYFCQKISH